MLKINAFQIASEGGCLRIKQQAVIFYFSGTGNTWWVSEELARQLEYRSIITRAYSIEKITPEKAAVLIEESDLVGFGYSIHGSDLPRPMIGFIESLPDADGKYAFVFCTQWLWSGDGAAVGASFLKKRGFNLQWGEHFLMPNNVTVSIIRLPYTNNPVSLSKVRNRAGRRIKHFAVKIAEGKPFYRGFSPISSLLGSMQRVPFRRVFDKLQNDIAIDRETCIDCGDCVHLCPTGNLYYHDAEICTRGNCILCLRCYNFCPVAAITYMGRRHLKQQRGEPYRGPVENFDPFILVEKE